jgi:hypothetical protein
MQRIWLSCPKFTVGVTVRDGKIVGAAPFVWRFVGQGFDRLVRWAEQFGPVTCVDLKDVKP